MRRSRCASNRRRLLRALAGIAFAVLAAARLVPPAAAAPSGPKLPPLRPHKAEIPPVIDGILDDAVWAVAPSETGFKTWRPDMGLDMHQNTVVYYAYDRENIYFAFRCFDAEPDKIKAAVSNRDNIFDDDWICVNLDSFDDQQSLYALYVNPLGIQADSRFEANHEDYSVDIVWYSAGRIDDQGYT
ncbi:MAG: carbohydrate binding family 9 domain-containing protein, partial [Candidatus Aminicenantes bacterium]|nr:carbohydrate binding family 9 domain-containing protein [Candidatus Aminicenantes bacterium]